jgi:pyruvate,orthophosphate dikinase
MIAARAVLTEAGGGTSHAAVIGRAIGVPCVVGCGPGTVLPLVGSTVTVDASAGLVHAGTAEVRVPAESDDPELALLIELAARHSPIVVLRSAAEHDGPVLDLDQRPDGADVAGYPTILAGQRAARGGAIASPDGVAAAIAAGLAAIVADPVLPVLLTAVQLQAGSERTSDG